MADLDAFESSSNNISNDPVAEFLAREQSALGDLDDDLIVNKDGNLSATNENSPKLNGDINNFEQPNGDVSHQLSNGISNLSLNNKSNSNMENSTAANTISQPPAEEPESIKRWREQHLKNLEAKDKEEKTKIDEHREQAKKELEEWYQRYKDQLSKTKKQNRENSKAAEKEWIAERDNEQPGQTWEKISRMCDFNPKTSRNNRDTSRMRSMMLQLKQSPLAASSSKIPS